MTAHELAKILLEGPDLPVAVYGFSMEGEKEECTDATEQKEDFRRDSVYVEEDCIFLS